VTDDLHIFLRNSKQDDRADHAYPADRKRSASLIALHALQEHFRMAVQMTHRWDGAQLDLATDQCLRARHLHPMFPSEGGGTKCVSKFCRTLSCALGAHLKPHHIFVTGSVLTRTWIACRHPGRQVSIGLFECLAQLRHGPGDHVQRGFFSKASRPRRRMKILTQCRWCNG